MIRKGIAYHIGYLPSSIRMRIEELFREGKIRTLFCTSTLLEGVNLKSNPNNFWKSRYQVTTYQDTKEFRNVLFGDTLEVIDNIILFSLSNYFLKFSNEFKKIHGVQSFENDWYEYVEYGTRNPTTILLQRVGFSRETATYIRQHAEEFIQNHEGRLKLSRSLLNCTNHNVRNEAANVVLNMPEAFSPNDTQTF